MSALREIAAHFAVDMDTKGLKKGSAVLEELKGLLGELAPALALGAVYHFITGLTEEADALQKQADAMGISLKEMQEWNYAASMQGVSAETLHGVLAKLGAGKYDKGLTGLGIATKKTDGSLKSSYELLGDVADKLSEIKDPAERNRKAIEVLGKSYTKMLPLLADGKEGIEALRKEFEEMGGGFTEEFAKDADEMGDNIDRLKMIWKNLSITAVSLILPTLVRLSKWVVATVKPIIVLVRHSKLLQTALIGAALKGFGLLSGKIGPLGSALTKLSGYFFRVILPLLILEDFLVFLSGGKSLFGKLVDDIFGSGTQQTVRDWISTVKKDFLKFIDELIHTPLKLLDDWEVFTTELKKDIRNLFGDYLGGWLINVGENWGWFINLLTGGWKNAIHMLKSAWDNMWINIWNGLLGQLSRVLGLFGQIAAKVPGAKALGAGLQDVAKGLEFAKVSPETVEAVKSAVTAASPTAKAISELTPGGKGGAVSQTIAPQTHIQVNVPPGTPEQQARAVGAAAKDGSQQGSDAAMRRARLALSPGVRYITGEE